MKHNGMRRCSQLARCYEFASKSLGWLYASFPVPQRRFNILHCQSSKHTLYQMFVVVSCRGYGEKITTNYIRLVFQRNGPTFSSNDAS
jgi:hypothetical protein